ncbi:carboxymuconolactone decarboxylase family protein [Cohnella lubricantis]|uniref:Carboxymuconolactone decarboxylase family protein n=1 Tax=Cohnella lubricantis TaxID=2163172 RepID=A0A841T3L7_9BACL|nr:carboxymuconolactone decarboxylase family protein [Cohnella lubricantis]MBB6675924.1 carboxymuconolactone decarboxylase family protein [Cohnella lubricantis]MBP2117159.1 4-carboxymuconolactone decarboxylase [Cohnella lubricantis]
MTDERYERGWEQLLRIDGEGGKRVIESLRDIAPDLGRYVVEFAFGDIYARPGLDARQRQLATIASLTTLGGCESQLNVHINAALNVGLTASEVVETLMHCAPYTGFPRVLNAVFVAKRIFAEREHHVIGGRGDSGDG